MINQEKLTESIKQGMVVMVIGENQPLIKSLIKKAVDAEEGKVRSLPVNVLVKDIATAGRGIEIELKCDMGPCFDFGVITKEKKKNWKAKTIWERVG